MALKSMNDLFLHTLKDIYYAEKQIYKSLPKMAKGSASPQLKQAFEKHHEETEKQIDRTRKDLRKLRRGRKRRLEERRFTRIALVRARSYDKARVFDVAFDAAHKKTLWRRREAAGTKGKLRWILTFAPGSLKSRS